MLLVKKAEASRSWEQMYGSPENSYPNVKLDGLRPGLTADNHSETMTHISRVLEFYDFGIRRVLVAAKCLQ